MNKITSALGVCLFLVLSAGTAAHAAPAADKTAPAAKAEAKPAPAKAEAKPAAAAGKEVTLKGTLGCAKCAFKQSKECQNVLKVKEGGKDVSYTLAKNGVSEENHEAVCTGTKPATVTGTVSEESGKKILTASQIKVE